MHITYSIRIINYWTPHRLGHFCTFSASKIIQVPTLKFDFYTTNLMVFTCLVLKLAKMKFVPRFNQYSTAPLLIMYYSLLYYLNCFI